MESKKSMQRKVPIPRLLFYGICLAIVCFLFVFSLGPANLGGIKHAWGSVSLQAAHEIGIAMYSYSNDNDLKYPDGKSSTEVFQKLMDGGYVTDPNLFYIPMPGKTRPAPGQKLKPENVSWDVTGGADASSSPDGLPIVFMTGYKVSYTPGGAAVPLVKPYPRFGWEDSNQTWFDWLMGRHTIHWSDSGGIAVFYKSNMAKFMILEMSGDSNGTVPNFVPPDFKPDGKTYRQLTPDGVLPDN